MSGGGTGWALQMYLATIDMAPPDREDRGLNLIGLVDLTHHQKNHLILVEGPEITIRPVAARLLTRSDAQ